MDSEISYQQALLFAMKALISLESEIDDFLAGYCRAAGHLLGEIYNAIDTITADDESDDTNEEN